MFCLQVNPTTLAPVDGKSLVTREESSFCTGGGASDPHFKTDQSVFQDFPKCDGNGKMGRTDGLIGTGAGGFSPASAHGMTCLYGGFHDQCTPSYPSSLRDRGVPTR
ncbi:hypothetical protein GCM10009837_49930 [Streptomyces durmitorensis]